jgi:hypothetical protein
VRGLRVIALLPRVRRLPDLLTHRTGEPAWSDGGVWFSCVFPKCAMVCSKRVQVRTRLCVSVRCRHVAALEAWVCRVPVRVHFHLGVLRAYLGCTRGVRVAYLWRI